MDAEEAFMTISMHHKEKFVNFKNKNIMSLIELKEICKKDLNITEENTDSIKLYLKNQNEKKEIKTNEEIIKFAEFTKENNFKIDLEVEIEEKKEIKLEEKIPESEINIGINLDKKENKNDIENVETKEEDDNKEEENNIVKAKEDDKKDEEQNREILDLKEEIKALKETINETTNKYNELKEEMEKNKIESINEINSLNELILNIKNNLRNEILEEIKEKYYKEMFDNIINQINNNNIHKKEESNSLTKSNEISIDIVHKKNINFYEHYY